MGGLIYLLWLTIGYAWLTYAGGGKDLFMVVYDTPSRKEVGKFENIIVSALTALIMCTIWPIIMMVSHGAYDEDLDR